MHFSRRYRQLHDTIASERLFMLNKAFDRSSIFDTVARTQLCQRMDDVYDSLGLTGGPSGPKAIAFPMTTLEEGRPDVGQLQVKGQNNIRSETYKKENHSDSTK
ncbi:Oidioi.mRNA.OKI2018_I69.chr1.g2815.t1.cds [Oikopleura dioica]|uniref:Oidioi.mRNA.OKI2018_I69.chr1.g2815.t1.cds n=1 Tax=Oikopleura dioica TaxID=34765 RepID=A0ABN7SWG9_OIKDI|nr:Oidioi.mRNA.OKI2018_I69.chr1.g2815.t1.cds [Oikopleura dioica]